MWTTTKLLIWGTTYPEFSKTYYETVCTGALDEDTGKLVRIYPIRCWRADGSVEKRAARRGEAEPGCS